jgi:hypothetical protein
VAPRAGGVHPRSTTSPREVADVCWRSHSITCSAHYRLRRLPSLPACPTGPFMLPRPTVPTPKYAYPLVALSEVASRGSGECCYLVTLVLIPVPRSIARHTPKAVQVHRLAHVQHDGQRAHAGRWIHALRAAPPPLYTAMRKLRIGRIGQKMALERPHFRVVHVQPWSGEQAREGPRTGTV